MKHTHTIIILDFVSVKVFIRTIDQDKDCEEFIEEMGLRANDCQYMVGNKLSIDCEI